MISKLLSNLFTKPMRICTHDGRFHCDQVLACAMLRRFTVQYRDATVTRSRDPAKWEQADIVVDVGGKYAAPKWLDHHQIEFQETYPEYPVRMSSAGLVYLNHPQIITNAITLVMEREKDKLTFEPILGPEVHFEVREKIYKNFIQYVDAIDNGVDKVNDKDITSVPSTLWGRVAKLNPMWWEEGVDVMPLFHQAMEIAEEEFYSQVRQTLLGSLQTKGMVKEAFLKRKELHPSGRIMLLTKYLPWQKAVTEIEQEHNCEGELLYVIFPDIKGGKWRIQAVAKKEGSFELRCGLKESWRGIKDEGKLKAVSGIEDIDFVHANGFIGGAVSQASAVVMGVESMKTE